MIVVDVNVIAYLLIAGERSEVARRVWARDSVWAVPDLWRHEFANVLVCHCANKRLSPGAAAQAWVDAQSLLAGREFAVNMAEAIRLAIQAGTSAYDAEFIVLAQQRDVPCVTEDKELLRKFPEVAVSMAGFLASGGSLTVAEAPAPYGRRARRRRSK